MTSRNDITQEYLKECFNYDHETGILIWKERPLTHFKSEKLCKLWNRRFSHKKAGCKRKFNTGKTYITVTVSSARCLAHRVVWRLVTGKWPEYEIDHIDGDGTNNLWGNLREVTRQGNSKNMRLGINNTSGFIGVNWMKNKNKWRAEIKVSGIPIHLGLYKSKQAAIVRRLAAELKYDFYPNHGQVRPK